MKDGHDNPYAPPAGSGDAPPEDGSAAAGGTIAISDHGWELVSELARWMRIVSGWTYAGGALLILGGLALLLSKRAMQGMGLSSLVFGAALVGTLAYGGLLLFAATWLRRSARHFYEGVIGDALAPLALAFRNLRLYLIVYGLIGLFSLAWTVYNLLR